MTEENFRVLYIIVVVKFIFDLLIFYSPVISSTRVYSFYFKTKKTESTGY